MNVLLSNKFKKIQELEKEDHNNEQSSNCLAVKIQLYTETRSSPLSSGLDAQRMPAKGEPAVEVTRFPTKNRL